MVDEDAGNQLERVAVPAFCPEGSRLQSEADVPDLCSFRQDLLDYFLELDSDKVHLPDRLGYAGVYVSTWDAAEEAAFSVPVS